MTAARRVLFQAASIYDSDPGARRRAPGGVGVCSSRLIRLSHLRNHFKFVGGRECAPGATTRANSAQVCAADYVAARLRDMVCAGKMSLKDAQDAFRKDWTKAYRQQVAALNAPGD